MIAIRYYQENQIVQTITAQYKEFQLQNDENGKFFGSTTRESMTYKGFSDGKVPINNSYGQLTYTIKRYGTNYLFKEEGKFSDTFQLTSGKRDIDNGYWKMVGEIDTNGHFYGLLQVRGRDDQFGSIDMSEYPLKVSNSKALTKIEKKDFLADMD